MTSQPDRAAPPTLAASLLTIEEAAAYLNVPQRWVADAVRQRRIRCTRIGKHVRFRIEHLEELIAAGEQPVTAPGAASVLALRPTRSSRSLL
ncbi:helix-turn-helix domain-containing protein [Nocardioides sp. NPDC051685]|uniref:helix-turn-helix domain-containing protein n=1 Tax=Nocardioides sp. NPDC051685 TaxID=3364334 RepID=UPI0037B97D53